MDGNCNLQDDGPRVPAKMNHVMNRILLTAGLVFVMSGPVTAQLTPEQKNAIQTAIPEQASVEPRQPRRVLIWNTPFRDQSPHRGFSLPQAEYAFVLMGEKTGAYVPVVSDDVTTLLPENIRRFDAIVMNNSNGPWLKPTEADLPALQAYGDSVEELEQVLRKSFQEWLEGGGGVVAFHHAIGGNPQWDTFTDIIGAGYWGHPWNEKVYVLLEEPKHPLLAAFQGSDFSIADEIFQFREPYSRDRLRVLLSLDTRRTDMSRPWIYRDDDDFALAWIHRYGEGRVFYSAFGHRTEIWWNAPILEFYLDGLQYATGDLPAPDGPSARAGIEPGFRRLFNGRDLKGWRGNPAIWSVQDGAISGRTTPDTQIAENDFLIWNGGEVENFELRLQYRILSGNSGIYFRSRERTSARPEALVGCQADISADQRWTGVVMEYTRRGILAERGQRTTIKNAGEIEVTGEVGDPRLLLDSVKENDWNDYTVLADHGHLLLKINGTTMCEVHDEDPWRIKSGKLALQVHRGPPMTVQFKNIRIRHLP